MYLPIEDHGVIGDLNTVALVGIDGTIDWCCLPFFDSPSVFGGLLDDEIGGWFRLEAQGALKKKQQYVPDSAILVTRTFAENGIGQIEDFMPIAEDGTTDHRISRRLSCVRGEVKYRLECRPAPSYGRCRPKVRLRPEGALFETGGEAITYGLLSPVALNDASPAVTADLVVKEGQCLSFVFFCSEAKNQDPFRNLPDPEGAFDQTRHFWQDWMSRCTYNGRWNEMVYRSALTLKLLTFRPTGAMVAAPTVGLPESLNGNRNWDYRYTWVRDASFTLDALMRIGYTGEASRFMDWIQNLCCEVDVESKAPLHVMYGIRGEADLSETELRHLKGYRGTKPVRIGNAAHDQVQLDIYGEFMDAVYIFNKYAMPVSYRLWEDCRKLMNWLCKNWDQPDAGIWESRGPKRKFVYSRLMCWVALDRASRISLEHSLPGNRNAWMATRDQIYDQIMSQGWNPNRKAFRQDYDSNNLDASTLLLPAMKFISPTDPRMISTMDAVLQSLTMDSLVYRYDPDNPIDDLIGEEGTFCMCTFWLVECLARAGRLVEARFIFEKMLGYANHLGLYSEEIGLHGEALGNFPQAFTHLGLISAATHLDRAINRRHANPSEQAA